MWDTRNRLFQRKKYDKWRTSGEIEVMDAAHKRIAEILSEEPQPILSTDQLFRMGKLVAEFDRRKIGESKQ